MKGLLRAAAVGLAAIVLTAHVGSPDVFFQGKAGPYDVRVVVRPPEVVPGVASVTVRAPADVQRVSIRPVFWRAGSKGAPSADDTRRLEGSEGGGTFVGSLWLMVRGAYTVDVIVDGKLGRANVLVPVASVATGRLDMNGGLAALLVVLGLVLCAGLVTIVYKAAGESLVVAGERIDEDRRRRARRVAAVSMPIIALALFGGARWWSAVDRDYERTLYRPAPLELKRDADVLLLRATDTVWQPPGRPSALVADHGKLMHLFLVRSGDARAFAHLHPVALDSSATPQFRARIPLALFPGRYHVFGDVVHETGLERTLVGTLDLPEPLADVQHVPPTTDPDDSWFAGDASATGIAQLPDGSTMRLEVLPAGRITEKSDRTLRISVIDARANPAALEPYLGMRAHGVVARLDGQVYVHLHPMGTVTVAARDAFLARDRGDTTRDGRLRVPDHSAHATSPSTLDAEGGSVDFPYAFPTSGDYRLFVQVKHRGRILTGSFAIPVDSAGPR